MRTLWAWFWTSLAVLFLAPFMVCLWLALLGSGRSVGDSLMYFLGPE